MHLLDRSEHLMGFKKPKNFFISILWEYVTKKRIMANENRKRGPYFMNLKNGNPSKVPRQTAWNRKERVKS